MLCSAGSFRRGITLCLFLAIIIFVLNLAVAIWASQGTATDEGNRVLQQGSCKSATRTNTVAHIGINILSALLLAASNYCMQICGAPTRDDIDKAHTRRQWLRIGVPSASNLRHVSWRRRSCWAVLCISSLPLHLIYNSVVFQTLVTNEYTFAEIDESFLEFANTSMVTAEMINVPVVNNGYDTVTVNTNATARAMVFNSMLLESKEWDNLTLLECARIYSQPLLSSHRSLVIVTKHDSSAQGVFRSYRVAVSNNNWMCPQSDESSGNDLNTPTTICSASESDFVQHTINPLYCLAEPVDELCTVEVSQAIIAAVCVANGIKILAICVVLFSLSGSPLITLGDAIASFLRSQDSTVRGLSTEDFGAIKSSWQSEHLPAKAWHNRARRRWHAFSKSKRTFVLCAAAISLVAVAILFAMALTADMNRGTGFLGNRFLSKPPNVIIGYESLAGLTISEVVVLVNTPQLVCSLLYFYYNAILTAFCQAREWNNFSLAPRSLRVSSRPRGEQQSSYYLSLPLRYAIPLLLLSGTLHWLISQSIFMLKVTFKNYVGGRSERFGGAGYGNVYGDHPGELLTSSYNTQGILCCLIAAILAYLVLGLVGSLRLKGDMVVAGSSSAVISAACFSGGEARVAEERYSKGEVTEEQRSMDQNTDMTERPLMWGELVQAVDPAGNAPQHGRGSVVGHLGFGTGTLRSPMVGQIYA